MAVSFNTTLHQSSLSPCCSIKLYSGLKPQSSSFLTSGYQNLNNEFYGRIHKSLQSGTGKASRSRVKMMPIGTPRVPYRNREEGTWQWVDIWNALYRERVIFIGQNIDEEFSNQILATMLYLDTLDDSRRIYMYLNGPGGDLTPSLAIYDTMKSLKSPVGTHCVGLAYNLAGFLLAAGEKNLNKEFYGRIHKSLQSGTGKASRSRVKMMPIGTPRVPYRNREEGTWQWVDIWNALYRERVIFIGQNIDEEFSNQILATMLYLDTLDDSRRIYMYLNGPGGDLTPSLAIYDTMKSLKSPVGTHCVGLAYNLAGFLLAAGEKGQRFAMPLSRIALTSPAGAARGQADDIQNEAKELSRIRDYLFNELAKNTGQPVETIFKDLSRVKRFNAEEAVEYGLIDKIVRPPRIKDDAPRQDETSGLG
ncbi:hypothetical protein F2Q68_00013292 [Brassica cretica]|uniref:ATP-dependent Clp protease proteolytic subunit n=1 Tax=Brassica cretica TaxID=69181 RepID=A0A8S9HN88_BRACR|nr:hypothetical protein F2Q68_00013292 [Brassica cretica]